MLFIIARDANMGFLKCVTLTDFMYVSLTIVNISFHYFLKRNDIQTNKFYNIFTKLVSVNHFFYANSIN